MKPQLFFGNKPKQELVKPIANNEFGFKAYGGLWTSSYENGKSEWVDWCESIQFFTTDNRDGWLLVPKEDARILEIDSLFQLKSVYSNYGENLEGGNPTLNFEAISLDYDGIHLTSNGQWETGFSLPYNLYGWDCECTHWFRWVFDEVKHISL